MKVKDLRDRIILDTDDKLIKFIDQEFGQNSDNTVHKIRGNLNTLSKLDVDILNYGISRMKKIEDFSDYSKFVSVIVTLVIAFIATYSVFFGKVSDSDIVQSAIQTLLTIFIFFVFIFLMSRTNKRRSQAVYFKSLLESALKKKI
jgi:hypothetical protein